MKESEIRKSVFMNGMIVKTKDGITQLQYPEDFKTEQYNEKIEKLLDAEFEKTFQENYGYKFGTKNNSNKLPNSD